MAQIYKNYFSKTTQLTLFVGILISLQIKALVQQP